MPIQFSQTNSKSDGLLRKRCAALALLAILVLSFVQLARFHNTFYFESDAKDTSDNRLFEAPLRKAGGNGTAPLINRQAAGETQNNNPSFDRAKDTTRTTSTMNRAAAEATNTSAATLAPTIPPTETTTTGDENHEAKNDGADTKPNRRPLNVLVLFPDDMSHKSMQDVSGRDYVETPFLTALARDGIRFTRNAVTTSVCWMSRATLFTGQYASSHGSFRLKCPRFTLPEYWKDTWPAILQRVGGYYVGHVGKWQYFDGKRVLPSLFNVTTIFEGRHWFGGVSASDKGYDSAKKFLENRPRDRPFALTVAFYPPKAIGNSYEPGEQWSPKQETMELYANRTYKRPYDVEQVHNNLPGFLKRGIVSSRFESRWKTTDQYNMGMRNYHALVTEVDAACQKIIDVLKSEGLYENTMIIFTSDNGLMMGSHGLGGKWIPYEDSIRVPLIIHDPRLPKEQRGRLEDSMSLNVDLASTILGAANIESAPGMQGRDLADIYLPKELATSPVDREPWRTEFVYEYHNTDIHRVFALIDQQYKYIDWQQQNYEQLFDLTSDPYELNDLLHNDTTKNKMTEVVKKLRERYNQIRVGRMSPHEHGSDWCNASLH